jgi:hypothetical protein
MAPKLGWVGGVVVASGLAATAWAQDQGAAVPDVSGHWRLNATLSSAISSDVAAAPAPEAGRKDVPKDVQKGAAPATPEGEKKPTELTITQSEAEIVVSETPGGHRSYYPNGKTYKADEGQSNVKSSWRDGKLVFEKRNVQGWRLTETWELSADRGRLTIDQRFEGGHRPKATVKRVYDRIEAK